MVLEVGRKVFERALFARDQADFRVLAKRIVRWIEDAGKGDRGRRIDRAGDVQRGGLCGGSAAGVARVVFLVGLTERSPCAGTSPRLVMEMLAASAVFQFRFVDWPQARLVFCAESCAVTGEIGTVALATPAWKRGCGPMVKPSFQSLVLMVPLRSRRTITFCPA